METDRDKTSPHDHPYITTFLMKAGMKVTST